MAGSSSPPLSDSSNLDSAGDSPEDDHNRSRAIHGVSEAGPSGSGGSKQRKKFHPFRAVRNIFRRAKRQGSEDDPQLHSSSSKKSRSTSELNSSSGLGATSPAGEQHRGYGSSSGLLLHPNNVIIPGGGGNGGLHAGLSVSHDSIFASEPAMTGSAALHQSGSGQGQPGSALSVPHVAGLKSFKDELRARFRGHHDSDEEDDDPGLPHSPCTSPTTADVLAQGLKDKSSKSHSSTCSAGSLISMCSSENDEEMSGMFSSGHSSRRSTDFEGDPDVSQPVPLNHNAALHKMAVRPKRTHGLPKHRRMQQIALAGVGQSLPATPEVTEDNSLIVLHAPQVEVTMHEESTVSGDLVELAEELVATSIYCTSPTTENIEQKEVELIAETSVTDVTFPEIVSETLPETPKSLEDSVAGPSVVELEVVPELVDSDIPPVKPPKSKAKSARLKFEHEVKQFSKRQQEKLKDPALEESVSLDINQNFEGELIETCEAKEEVVEQVDEHVEAVTVSLQTKEEIEVGEVKLKEVLEVPEPTKDSSKPTKDMESEKPTVFMVESVSESLMNVFFGNDVVTEPQPPQEPMHISEITLKDPVEPTETKQIQSTVSLDEVPKVSGDSLELPVEIEEPVILRHPERASLISAPEKPSQASNSEIIKKPEAESPLKPTELAFSSGDFAGIMKKRRSMIDSLTPVEIQNNSSRRSTSDDLRKPSTPSKRLSVEILSFDERTKEQPSVRHEDSKKEEELSTKSSKNTELPVENSVSVVEPSPPCPPVTIRIRRGNSLSERLPEINSVPVPVKPVEKPVVRPRSQILNQDESQGKVPEFMKIQLRSSREELDSCKSEPKSESVVAAQPPHWEVKIQPQKIQRKLSAGPTSLPYNLGKPSSPDSKNDVEVNLEIKSIPQMSEVTKDVESRAKLPLQKLETKPDLPVDTEQRLPKLTVHKPDARTEVTRDVDLRPKQGDERQNFRPDDSSKSKRNSSSENKENVALSNVQNDLIERRISVDELRQEQSGEKPAGTDNRRRSYVFPKEVEDHEPELFRVFARRSIKQKHPDKSKKDETSKDDVKTEANAMPKPDVSVSRPDTAQTPIKLKVETKLLSEEKILPKRNDPLPNKPLLREHSKPLDKIVTPPKVSEMPESPASKSLTPSTSPKIQSPEIFPVKPERRESLSFRNKAPESPETKIDKPMPQVTKNRSYTDPVKPTTPNVKASEVPVCKIERRESASFKVKPSENTANKSFSPKDKIKMEAETPKPVLAAKRAEFVKMASLDSSSPKDGNKDAPTWLQLAQQRREKREQKERMLYGQNSNSFVLEGSNKPSRNSKVLDLVNNFQKKLQTT